MRRLLRLRSGLAAVAWWTAIAVASSGGAADVRLHSVVLNGGYELGLLGWTVHGGARVTPRKENGRCLRIEGAGSARQDVPFRRIAGPMTVAVDVAVRSVGPGPKHGFVFAAVYMYSAEGSLLAFKDFVQVRTPQDWKRCSWTFEPPHGCALISLRCGVYNAVAEAAFDGWTLVPGRKPAEFSPDAGARPFSGAERGVVGVFREPGFPGRGAPASPETLAEIIQPAVDRVVFLNATELADPEVLRPDRFDLVVLPYGESFPAEARDAFIAYLHAGGDFLSVGGYAFSVLMRRAPDGGWMHEEEFVRRRIAEALKPDRSLVPDGGFEKQAVGKGAARVAGGWQAYGRGCAVERQDAYEGRQCAVVRIPRGDKAGGARWEAVVPVVPGHTLRVHVAWRTQDVEGAGYAYAAVYQFGEDDRLIAFRDFLQTRGDHPWTVTEDEVTIAAGVRRAAVRLGLYRATGTVWFDDVRMGDVTGLRTPPMNTRTGIPKDGLVTRPDQIGIFDADFRLERVDRVVSAGKIDVFPSDTRLSGVRGWAATAVLGDAASRWTPLLTALDRYGRNRGAAAALVRHYSGFYTGSSWAIFGVDNRDIFAGPSPALADGLRRLVQVMVKGVFLRSMEPGRFSVRPGSAVPISVTVENQGARVRSGTVHWRIATQDGRVLLEREQAVTVEPFSPAELSIETSVPNDVRGLVKVEASAVFGGVRCDSAEAGFVVFDRLAPHGCSPFTFRDNYFRLGDRPIFVFGTDAYANDYHGAGAGPLRWEELLEACRDFGFLLYENLQYSHPDHRMRPDDWDRFRAMTRLAQDHGVVFMPGMLIGHNVAVSVAEVKAEQEQCREYAKHLSEAPRLLWYVNGDYHLRYDDKPALRERWNAFLRKRYRTDAALRAAWAPRVPAAPLGRLPFPPERGRAWDDPVALDLSRFNIELLRSWNQTHVDAVRSIDRLHPITSEYYSTPFNGIDLRLTLDGLDVSNFGFFGGPERDIEVLPLRLRWNDVRARGRSVGLGEYGVKTHPAWKPENGGKGYHVTRTREQQQDLFITVALCTFAMGGSKVQNWCLQDAPERVFPWGVLYACPTVPKDVACTHRNLSLLLRAFAPRYEAPSVTLLLCDNMRLDNRGRLGFVTAERAAEALLQCRVPFNVLSDTFIAELPESTRVLIWPAALCPPDDAFDRALDWVRNGGMLLITGDFGFDQDRRHTRSGRFERLAGVRHIESLYRPDSRNRARVLSCRSHAGGLDLARTAPQVRVEPVEAEVLVETADGFPLVTRRGLGKGSVVFCADPLELGDDVAPVRSLYSRFLKQAGVPRLRATPDVPDLFVFEQPVRTGTVHVVVDRTSKKVRLAELPVAGGNVRVGTRFGRPAMVAVGKDGRILAAVTMRELRVNGEPIIRADGCVGLLSLDGRDLRAGRAVLLLPFSKGRVRFTVAAPGRHGKRRLLLGDVHGGRFRVLERLDAGRDGLVQVDVDPDRATLIGLCTARKEAEQWIRALNRLIAAPETLPGY